MEDILKIFNNLASSFLQEEEREPVAKSINPLELNNYFNLELNDNELNQTEFIELLEKIILNTPKIASKQFYNQLYGGRNKYAVLGDLLAVILNSSMYTYKVAGPMVGIEKEIIKKSCELLGIKNAAGTFAAGGSITNLMSMIMARDWHNRDIKYNGVKQDLIVYTSVDSHYSITKNASFTGLGKKNVHFIEVDEFGQMDAKILEQKIIEDKKNNCIPFYINATAGTTVLGAFDPILEIAKIAKTHKLWLHVDGAYCGASFFSKKYKNKLNGVEKADSFSYNGHKMLNTPTNCSIILTKHKDALYNSFSNEASYLFQKDSDEFNFGKTSMQCGRRNDALKFWTLWKALGTKGLEKMVDHLYETANTAFEYVKNNKDYTLYSFPNSLSVCFNYKNIDAKKLSYKLHENQISMVSYATHNKKTFIRFVNINTLNSNKEVLNFFNNLETFVEENPGIF